MSVSRCEQHLEGGHTDVVHGSVLQPVGTPQLPGGGTPEYERYHYASLTQYAQVPIDLRTLPTASTELNNR